MKQHQLTGIALVWIGLATIFLVGCASTEKRYEQAIAYETEGRFVEATWHYVRVLEKEPSWEEARTRLNTVAPYAVEDYLSEARSWADRAEYEAALSVLNRLEELDERAVAVGAPLPLPADYSTYRKEYADRAIADLMARGDRALAERQWDKALKAYARAQKDFPMSDERYIQLERARANVYVRWAEHEMVRYRYLAAYERADDALAMLGPETPEGATMMALQEEALAEGIRYVAFLPFWEIESWQREAPRYLLREVNDILTYEQWAESPLFIASIDPVPIRRELRRLRYDETQISSRKAAEIGRVLDADLVVTGELVGFEAGVSDEKRETRTARTRGRGGRDTTYVVREYELRLTAEAEYHIIDPATRRVLAERKVSVRVSDQFKRGEYAGNPTSLDLSSRDRRLFDQDEWDEQDQDLENKLAETLSLDLANHIYEDLLQWIMDN